tara:strand:- start:946 stop:1296 length:351 start_codon:yes stop_codon:yes gene_type:complete
LSTKPDANEQNIQCAILELMRDQKVWTNAELKKALPRKINLTDDDMAVGVRGEPLWLNRVNNALRQSTASSLYGKGHVENKSHGEHQITDKGLKFIHDDFSMDDLMDALKSRKKQK